MTQEINNDLRWLGLSVKKLSVASLLLLSVVTCGWGIAQQRLVAARLESLGASVTYYRANVIGIGFPPGTHRFGDQEMSLLEELPYLQWLNLDDTNVTSEGLTGIRGLPRLNSLYLRVDQISVYRERTLQTALPHLRITKFNRTVLDGFHRE